MAASDHLQNHQLSMFIPARELMDYTAGHTEGFDDKYLLLSKSPGIIRQKLEESKEKSSSGRYGSKDSLHDSIKKEGVKYPIALRIRKKDVQINDGHHRVVAAHDIDPNMEIPVRYS